jgi:hypothetical protein
VEGGAFAPVVKGRKRGRKGAECSKVVCEGGKRLPAVLDAFQAVCEA